MTVSQSSSVCEIASQPNLVQKIVSQPNSVRKISKSAEFSSRTVRFGTIGAGLVRERFEIWKFDSIDLMADGFGSSLVLIRVICEFELVSEV